MFKTVNTCGALRRHPDPAPRTSPIRHAGNRAVDFTPPSTVQRLAQKRLAIRIVAGWLAIVLGVLALR